MMDHLSHDIVSILYSMKGIAETYFAKSEEQEGLTSLQRYQLAEASLRRLLAQAEKGLFTTKRLRSLLLEVPGNPAKACSRRKVSLRYVWERVREKLAQDFDLATVDLIEDIPDFIPPLLCGREDLTEILYLLVKNAMDAIYPLNGWQRMVLVRAQLMNDGKEAPRVLLMIADSGPGICEKQLPLLFKPFFTTKPDGIGNGLGLYLAKQLAEKNNGKIAVTSCEDLGTTFKLEFQAAPPEQKKRAA